MEHDVTNIRITKKLLGLEGNLSYLNPDPVIRSKHSMADHMTSDKSTSLPGPKQQQPYDRVSHTLCFLGSVFFEN